MKITRFTGINNVQPAESLLPDKYGATALREAMNVDIDLAGELVRREGLTKVADACADVFEGAGFQLAQAGGDLVRIVSGTPTTVASGIGADRLWCANLPDGRTAWNNGSASGIVGPSTVTGWGVPTPVSAGTIAAQDGAQLFAGKYLGAITYVRADGVESAPAYTDAITLTDGQTIAFTNLPVLAGHTINVYMTHHNGDTLRLAGQTPNDTADSFAFLGTIAQLVRECKTEQTDPAPAGRILAVWRGHALVADGPILWGSRHIDFEHFDLDKDFKPFSADITAVIPVQEGVFVGTEQQLVFLRGQNFRELAFERASNTPVVLGSGVNVPGRWLQRGDADAGQGECGLCIAAGSIVACYQDGFTAALTERSYSTDATEVSAAFRVRRGIPQYVAVPR